MTGHSPPFAQILADQGFVILDGALATELERRGADLRDPLWSAKLLIESPELIQTVHADYLNAGADIISTASYQATLDGFMARGLTYSEAVNLLLLSVKLAVDARDEYWATAAIQQGRHRPLVAASIGPYGAYLANGSEYSGSYGLSVEELMDFHRPRVAVLAESDADILAFETIPCLDEARAIIQLLKEFPHCSAWLSFSCCDGYHTCHGESITQCALLAESSDQIVAVGINCTAPRFISSLIREASRRSTKPIVVYPNSGESWDAKACKWVTGSQAESIAASAEEWYGAGARLIGGCCRTTPDDIAQVRFALIGVH